MEVRLLRVVGGICHFSRVTVRAEVAESGIKAGEAFSIPTHPDEGEVDRASEPEWIDAAVQGALDCGRVLTERGRLGGCRVEVVRVVGSPVDTIPADVRCAAFLATWTALLPDTPPLPSLSRRELGEETFPEFPLPPCAPTPAWDGFDRLTIVTPRA